MRFFTTALRLLAVVALCLAVLGTTVRADVPVYTLSNAPATPPLSSLALTTTVSQYGITWTFSNAARVGQFINGDWYVVGPVTVLTISPAPLWGAAVPGAPDTTTGDTEIYFSPSYARNGSTLNMPAVVPTMTLSNGTTDVRTRRSGFDSRMQQDQYDPNQFTPLPINMNPGDSLVSSISASNYTSYQSTAVAILTCVSGPQPPDAFRPSFCKSSTCPQYLSRNLQRQLLCNLSVTSSVLTGILPDNYVNWFQAPLIDTVGGGNNMPPRSFNLYEICQGMGETTLLLNLNFTAAQKETLLVYLVQTAIDLHGMVRGGGGWPAEGASPAGRKWPIVFAGLMLNDPTMYDLPGHYPAARFHEDEQTWFCPLTYIGVTYSSGWTGAKVVWTGHYAYYKGVWYSPNSWDNSGPYDLIPPSQWLYPYPYLSEPYRRNSTSPCWVAEALAARIMHAEKFWHHDAFFAYVDRWMTENDAPFKAIMVANVQANDPADYNAANTSTNGQTIDADPGLQPLVQYLWNTYRNNLPPNPDGTVTPSSSTTWR